MTKPTGKVNPTYRLTEQERYHVAILGHMNLWPKDRIARAYDITRHTVLKCMRRYPLTKESKV